MRENNQAPIRILLAEDNPGDVFLVRRALVLHHVDFELTVVADGSAALQAVEQADSGESAGKPDLMLVDLNLPRVSGTRILEKLRESRTLAGTPVIVVTSSDLASDRESAARLGATHYFHKPTDLAGFMELGAIVLSVLSDSKAAQAAG